MKEGVFLHSVPRMQLLKFLRETSAHLSQCSCLPVMFLLRLYGIQSDNNFVILLRGNTLMAKDMTTPSDSTENFKIFLEN